MNRRNFFSYVAILGVASYLGKASGGMSETKLHFGSHIHNPVNINLARTKLFEVGRKAPYFRYMEFPVEVSEKIT